MGGSEDARDKGETENFGLCTFPQPPSSPVSVRPTAVCSRLRSWELDCLPQFPAQQLLARGPLFPAQGVRHQAGGTLGSGFLGFREDPQCAAVFPAPAPTRTPTPLRVAPSGTRAGAASRLLPPPRSHTADLVPWCGAWLPVLQEAALAICRRRSPKLGAPSSQWRGAGASRRACVSSGPPLSCCPRPAPGHRHLPPASLQPARGRRRRAWAAGAAGSAPTPTPPHPGPRRSRSPGLSALRTARPRGVPTPPPAPAAGWTGAALVTVSGRRSRSLRTCRTLWPGPTALTALGPGRVMTARPAPPATNGPLVLFLGLSVLAVLSGANVKVHMPAGLTKLQAVEGRDIVLPAWYTLEGEKPEGRPWEVPLVMWFLEKKEKKGLKQVLAYINGSVSGNPGVSLVYSMPSRNVSLRLQGLQEKDSGSYSCSVNVQDRGHDSKTMELSVLVPPATPSCSLLGVPQVGANVTLSCQSPRSDPLAHYQWERLSPVAQVFFAPVLDNIRGSLKLTNLSTSMSGIYLCTAQNIVGSAHCNVTLSVITGSRAAMIAGAVVGTLVGLVLLVGLILLYERQHQSKLLEDVSNDIKEDATAPRTLTWSKASDTLSKNGTLSSVTSARALRLSHAPPKPGTLTPVPGTSTQALPSPRLPETNGTNPQPVSLSPGGLSHSALRRMGAVNVMLPSQTQDGYLV
ncbi:endothelial cell-selective adhesion molecule isoform X3 [Cavia porcellus]|uniref:endothelial cell-selective adhesion molecule isoform X3 n=1 Tax=Cavia porcellus TaxID=10141 RepID=UPI002FE36A9C